MMTRLFNSGKFWLKTVFFGSLTVFLLFIGLSASVYHFLSPERIYAAANDSIRDTGRRIRFDKTVSHSWFPRPTVTLSNLIISRPNGTQPAISIKKTTVGLAWASLWQGRPVIEKWLIEGADATIERSPAGRWNLQDLWQQQSRNGNLNRLVIENSRIRLRLIHNEYDIRNFMLNTEEPDSDGRAFKIAGVLQHAKLPLNFTGAGVLKAMGKNWRVPAFNLEAQGRLNGEKVKISADSDLLWQPQKSLLEASGLSVRADSSYQNLHFNAQVPQLKLDTEHLSLNTLNSAFTAGNADGQWNGSLQLGKTDIRPNVATLGGFDLNAGYKDRRLQTGFKASGGLFWQRKTGLRSDQLHLNLVQDTLAQAPKPRFISTLAGEVNMSPQGVWQGHFDGMFDRQPVDLVMRYERGGEKGKLEAGVALQKLVLNPYWQDLREQDGRLYPDFLEHPLMPDIEAQLKIDAIQMPGLQLDNVNTLVSADRNHIALSNFSAGLYGGITEGGISLANTEPVSYHLQQNAQGVQIQPLLEDLFGFHNFRGTGDAVIDVTAKGSDRKSLIQSLNGSLTLNVADGAWVGIDMNNILQGGRVERQDGRVRQTPFERFSLTSIIENGVSNHINAELFSDSLLVSTSGHTDLYRQILSEELLIRNAQNPLARPVPLKIAGPIGNLSVTLDYNRLTDGLETPEEKKRALEETLREQWQWLMPKRR